MQGQHMTVKRRLGLITGADPASCIMPYESASWHDTALL
jgi:hypothetical protein